MPCEADVSSKSRSTLFFSHAGAGMNTGAPSRAAGLTDLERRSSHALHDSICRAMRLRIRMLNFPSQPCSTAANSGQLPGSDWMRRATNSAPSDRSMVSRKRPTMVLAFV